MKRKMLTATLCFLLLASAPTVYGEGTDLGREVLGPNDGWAAYGTGTTGGAAAAPEHVYTVSNKSELIQALGGNNATNGSNSTPKIIYIDGTIDINTDNSGNEMGYEEYKDPAFDFQQYLAAYDPAVWGYDDEVSGPLEDARKRSSTNQKNNIIINVGSNTTMVGLGEDAKIIGGAFSIKGVDNVIIRNIEFVAPVDYFPGWDPTDGSEGNWNSEYDSITVDNSRHVWIDHNTFNDGDLLDSTSGSYFGRPFQQHDGLIDVKNASDYVTISYNVFEDHDKVMLIGSSDSSRVDPGHLKVTLHHNIFKNLSQRLPRIRFGEVHVYNNLYMFEQDSEYDMSYVIGVGISSKGYVENNYFYFDYEVDPSEILDDYKGTSIYDNGNYIETPSGVRSVDLVAEFNSANTWQFDENVGWTPTLHQQIIPAVDVRDAVEENAGVGKLN